MNANPLGWMTSRELADLESVVLDAHVSPWPTVADEIETLEAVKSVHGPGLCDDHTCPLCWRPKPWGTP